MLQATSRKRGSRATDLATYTILILGGLTFALPFIWMVLTSFKSGSEVFLPHIVPREPTLLSYQKVFDKLPLGRWYLNTFITAAVNVVAVVVGSSVAGYGLSKYSFPGQNLFLLLILSTMMVPQEMLIIPWYIAAVRLDWVDTYAGVIFPGLVSASSVFIMRQFMQTMPDELLDAGRIDGVSELGLLWRVVLPLTRPAVATVCVLTFMANWNSYLWPLIVLEKTEMFTLQLGLAHAAATQEGGASDWSFVMAVSTLASVPGIVALSLMHRQIVQGIVLTGLKG